MSPVQEGSVVVYVIDNTGSLGPHRKALFDAFDGLTGGASSPNVRLAALKHGYGPNHFPPPAVERLKKNLFDFSLPADIPVDTLRAELTFNYNTAYEQLYPGIMVAWEMIKEECPPGVDLVAKPWCQRKVIVALGDGDPGMSLTNTDYFPQPDAYLPTNLLSGLKKAEIQVDTLCAGGDCEDGMYRCNDRRPDITWFGSECSSPPAGLRGREIMAALSLQTGGVYHGVAK